MRGSSSHRHGLHPQGYRGVGYHVSISSSGKSVIEGRQYNRREVPLDLRTLRVWGEHFTNFIPLSLTLAVVLQLSCVLLTYLWTAVYGTHFSAPVPPRLLVICTLVKCDLPSNGQSTGGYRSTGTFQLPRYYFFRVVSHCTHIRTDRTKYHTKTNDVFHNVEPSSVRGLLFRDEDLLLQFRKSSGMGAVYAWAAASRSSQCWLCFTYSHHQTSPLLDLFIGNCLLPTMDGIVAFR